MISLPSTSCVSRKGGTGIQKDEDNMAMSGLGCALGQSQLQGFYLLSMNLRRQSSHFVWPLIPAFKADFSARVGYHCQ